MRLISPRYLAEALGVSESSLKRWVDAGKLEAARTEGGHRRIALAEALRFIRETGTPVVKPELLDLPEVAASREHGDRLYDHLLAGDAPAVRGWLFARYLEGQTLAQLADGPIRTAMYALGDLWRHDPQGIFIEHRATAVVLQAVAQLRSMLAVAPANAPLALGGAPSGDPYLLPSQLACMVVEEAGLRAVNLGPETPVDALEPGIGAEVDDVALLQ
jgi:excisionase family DNA binding protein